MYLIEQLHEIHQLIRTQVQKKVNKNSAVVYDRPVSDSINRPPPTHWATVAENKKIIIHNAESITTALLLYLPLNNR